MHNVVLVEYLESLQQLCEDLQRLFLREFNLLPDFCFQCFPIAKLIDEVEVVGSLKHLYEPDDVGTLLNLGEVSDLVSRALLESRVLLELLYRDDLDGEILVVESINALIDLAETSLP